MSRRSIAGISGHFDPIVMVCKRLRIVCLEHVPLAPRTTWKIGGSARWLIQPANIQELQQLLLAWPEEVPRLVLGGGSNLLIDDDGFQGVVLDLKHRINQIYLPYLTEKDGQQVQLSSEKYDYVHAVYAEPKAADDTILLHVGAGATTRSLAHFARTHGLTGAEFLGGIPGSIGGALRMNAGAYGGEMRNILLDVELLDAAGLHQSLRLEQLGMSYRKTKVPADWIFLSARLRLQRDDPGIIRERMRSLNRARKKSQPLRFASAGSTFKNPLTGPKAWQWIDAAGMRGVAEGQAQVSEQHSNFLINRGGARSRDMQILIDRVRERVLQVGGEYLALEVGVVTPVGMVTG